MVSFPLGPFLIEAKSGERVPTGFVSFGNRVCAFKRGGGQFVPFGESKKKNDPMISFS